MITWVVIVLLILLVFVFLRFRHFKHKLFAVAIILLILFFYITASKIIAKSDIDLKSFTGVMQVTKLYFSWFADLFINIKDLTANVIKMDWLPGNTSIK